VTRPGHHLGGQQFGDPRDDDRQHHELAADEDERSESDQVAICGPTRTGLISAWTAGDEATLPMASSRRISVMDLRLICAARKCRQSQELRVARSATLEAVVARYRTSLGQIDSSGVTVEDFELSRWLGES